MEYIRGQLPQLKMVREEDGEEKGIEVAPIEKWSSDNIVEYLKEHLE